MTAPTLESARDKFNKQIATGRAPKLSGEEWAELGPDYWPGGEHHRGGLGLGDCNRSAAGGGGSVKAWTTVEAAQRRGQKRLKALPPDATDEQRTQAVAEWQADERAREGKQPRKAPPVTQAPQASPAMVDVFRMYRRDLEALGTPEATAELKRREAKRTAKQAATV